MDNSKITPNQQPSNSSQTPTFRSNSSVQPIQPSKGFRIFSILTIAFTIALLLMVILSAGGWVLFFVYADYIFPLVFVDFILLVIYLILSIKGKYNRHIIISAVFVIFYLLIFGFLILALSAYH